MNRRRGGKSNGLSIPSLFLCYLNKVPVCGKLLYVYKIFLYKEIEQMIKLYDGGVYLVNGTEVVPEAEAAKVEALTGKSPNKEDAKTGLSPMAS